MDDDIYGRMFRALCLQLLASDKLDPEDVYRAADMLDAEGDGDAAHELRCLPLIAAAGQPSTEHERRRARMRVVHDVPKESD